MKGIGGKKMGEGKYWPFRINLIFGTQTMFLPKQINKKCHFVQGVGLYMVMCSNIDGRT